MGRSSPANTATTTAWWSTPRPSSSGSPVRKFTSSAARGRRTANQRTALADRLRDDDRHADGQRAEQDARRDISLFDHAADVERIEPVEDHRGREEEQHAKRPPEDREPDVFEERSEERRVGKECRSR